MIPLPKQIEDIIGRLNEKGFAAYAVGGCVRDSLMKHHPHDWDITTSAAPDEVAAVFPVCIGTGIRHGTVTVVLDDLPVEVTTFRTEGGYADHRRPDAVSFTTSLEEDLARRDFTINAMAYHPKEGLIDRFGGLSDLKAGIIRTVGEPERRFSEDALRILRALRFAACLGFSVEPLTMRAVHDRLSDLRFVAPERLWREWITLLCGKKAAEVLRAFPDAAAKLFPPLGRLMGFDQKSPHHSLDVWEHTLLTLEQTPPIPALRLAALLHDVGKPDTFTVDANGVGHFYGHHTVSAEIARQELERFHADRKTVETVCFLILHHMDQLSIEPAAIRRALNRYGEERLRALVDLIGADGMATVHAKEAHCRREAYLAALEQVLAETPCLKREDLAVNGNDLIAAGITEGREIGRCLEHLLQLVLDGRLPNERNALLREIEKR